MAVWQPTHFRSFYWYKGGNVPSAPTSHVGVEAHGPLQGEAEGQAL